MYKIDNEKFGSFLAELRKERGYTQAELAKQLFVSDKAVSKWERGLCMPDVSLLIPLSHILNVTVTELLEGRKIERTEQMNNEQIETLVKKTIGFSEEASRFREPALKKRAALFAAGTLLVILEIMLLFYWNCNIEQMGYTVFLVEGLTFVFGLYFWFFAKKELPSYYDENHISLYCDGIFRMNVPGVYFNNRNWPHIVRGLRIWLMLTMIGYPFLYLLLDKTMNEASLIISLPLTLAVVFSMFIPVYRNGRKYR